MAFVGRGERIICELLHGALKFTKGDGLYGLPVYNANALHTLKELGEHNRDGIYVQVPIPEIISEDERQDLSDRHAKSSVDIVVIYKGTTYAIRVQNQGRKHGHYGEVKSRFDSVQKQMLKRSGIKVIDIWEHECPNIFKTDEKDIPINLVIQEFLDALWNSDLLIPVRSGLILAANSISYSTSRK